MSSVDRFILVWVRDLVPGSTPSSHIVGRRPKQVVHPCDISNSEVIPEWGYRKVTNLIIVHLHGKSRGFIFP